VPISEIGYDVANPSVVLGMVGAENGIAVSKKCGSTDYLGGLVILTRSTVSHQLQPNGNYITQESQDDSGGQGGDRVSRLEWHSDQEHLNRYERSTQCGAPDDNSCR
jgi:hypothetical protein